MARWSWRHPAAGTRPRREADPAGGSGFAGIRTGMHVLSTDGVALGRIDEVWCGEDPAASAAAWDDEHCSRLEIERKGGALFVPYSAIASVSRRCLTLAVAARAAREAPSWRRPPAWLKPLVAKRDRRRRETQRRLGGLGWPYGVSRCPALWV